MRGVVLRGSEPSKENEKKCEHKTAPPHPILLHRFVRSSTPACSFQEQSIASLLSGVILPKLLYRGQPEFPSAICMEEAKKSERNNPGFWSMTPRFDRSGNHCFSVWSRCLFLPLPPVNFHSPKWAWYTMGQSQSSFTGNTTCGTFACIPH